MGYSLQALHDSGPLPLTDGIGTEAEWALKREKLLSVWLQYLGELPPRRTAPEWEVLSEEQEETHVRRKIRYSNGDGDSVSAYLLVPAGAERGERTYPAVLALHPTAEEGKADTATPAGRTNRRYGLELAERGYVVLAPDAISFGERVYPGAKPFQTAPFYARFPERTAVGQMISDHMHGVDLLASLPYAAPDRIGAIGHSLGGYNAFFLAGVDDRIKAIVSSCGFTTFSGDPEPNRWGARDWFSHIPRISADLAEGTVPFEFHEIAALAAPVPFLNWNGTADHIFPNWKPAVQAMQELERLYGLLGAEPGRLTYLFGNSGHDFPPAIREAAYAFLDRWLRFAQ